MMQNILHTQAMWAQTTEQLSKMQEKPKLQHTQLLRQLIYKEGTKILLKLLKRRWSIEHRCQSSHKFSKLKKWGPRAEKFVSCQF